MRQILITGISGFVGSTLAGYLLAQNVRVSGVDLRAGALAVDYHLGEIANKAEIAGILAKTKPDVIFHLAGVIKSQEPEVLYKANLLGTVALFDAIIEAGLRPMVVMASSSAVYGQRSGETPIDEQAELRPITHYAVSKVAQEIAALRYFDAYGLPVIVIRMFNLLGPGQSPDLACSSFARQIALAELNGWDEISTGNLDAQRDFVDVRDAARAFVLAAEKGVPGQVYNVCSGRPVTIQKCLDEMISMSAHPIKARVDAARIQKNDVPIQVGSADKIKNVTGWRPEISLKQSLADLLNDWRQRVKEETK